MQIFVSPMIGHWRASCENVVRRGIGHGVHANSGRYERYVVSGRFVT